MFCKTCDTKLADNSVFCPNCGNTVQKMNQNYSEYSRQEQGVYQQPFNYGQYNYSSVNMQNNTAGKIDIFKPIFLLAAVIFIIIGIFVLPFCRSATYYPINDEVFSGVPIINSITSIRITGLEEFLENFSENEDEVKLLFIFVGIDIIMAVTAAIFAVIAIVKLCLKNEKASLKMLGISLFFPMIGYIVNMIAGFIEKNELNEIREDIGQISIVPVIMAFVCIALAILAFMAAKADEHNHSA
ncbi:MAG: zinc ribbon domain-containing protein [Ruminococcus flavefaciens]|nr:zinc ribbon domain-containing protein [Ruminococcus flavefaciens]MCM1360852.1 zinc ribbon domain-containing protein [Clostridiales bacterium]MCM1434924.1 zinc ribbon domain-containing protein [Ruminococcus flavefaciens]